MKANSWNLRSFKGGRIQWHLKTLLKFKQKIRELTNRNWGVSMKYQLFKISQYLRGWINYFGIANSYQLCVDLDHWIRRRVRMAYWRKWRKPRTKVRNLMSRGVHVQASVACGSTSTYSPYITETSLLLNTLTTKQPPVCFFTFNIHNINSVMLRFSYLCWHTLYLVLCID